MNKIINQFCILTILDTKHEMISVIDAGMLANNE